MMKTTALKLRIEVILGRGVISEETSGEVCFWGGCILDVAFRWLGGL